MERNTEIEKPLVDNTYLLERFQGKGGWTYAIIPEIAKDKHAHFGIVKVNGSIDDYEIRDFHLMPMGNGMLFLPVKAEIRKVIGKQEGDWVHIVLYADQLPSVMPEDLLLCLKDEPAAYETFLTHTAEEQKAMIDWIYSAKKDETKVERIAMTLDKLAKR